MVLNRLSGVLGRLGIIVLSLLTSPAIFAVDYVVIGPNTFQGGISDGYPPTLTLNLADTVNILPAGQLTGPANQIHLASGGTSVVNSGLIQAIGFAAGILTDPITTPFSITNSGIISGFVTIGLQANPGGTGTLTNTGTINGLVILSQNANSTVNINGGIINGVIGRAAGLGVATININNTFAMSLPFELQLTDLITVNNAGTLFTANQNIDNFATLTVGAGTTMNVGATLTGSLVTNLGTTNLNAGGVIAGPMFNSGLLNIFPGANITGLLTNANTGVINLAGALTTSVTNSGLLNILPGADIAGLLTNTTTGIVNLASTLSGSVTNSGLLNIYPGANIAGALINNNTGVINLASNLTGSVTNNGLLSIGMSPHTIAGTFTQNPIGTLSLGINGFTYGSIIGGPGSSFAGTVNVSVSNTGLIPNGTLYNIVTAPTGLAVVGIPVVNIFPPSPLITFRGQVTPTAYQLVAERNSLANPLFGIGLGVAAALEEIRASGTATPAQALILERLDALPDAAAIHLALLQLSPETNGGTLLCTQQLLELAFTKITRGLHSMRAQNSYTTRTGYSAGDIADGRGSYGPLLFVTNTTVKEKFGIPGFNALGSGVGLAGDIPVTGGGPFCGSPFITKVGAAGTYAGTRLKNNPNIMDSNITSWQAIFYGTVDYNLFFLEAYVGFATNHYINTRHTFLGQNARGDFYGEQRQSLLNTGLNLPMGNLEIAPYFSLRNGRVTQNQYTERGAPGENLIIQRRVASSQQGGGGGKIIDVSQSEDFIPEVHVLFLTELRSPNLNSTAVFAEGSPAFITVGRPLNKNSVIFGFSASGVIKPGLIVTLSYDLESRTNFWSHFGAIKIRGIF